ncbi:hypothetical protein LMJF_23_0840 [Leishmania major strain Friedlin]|uniref:Uncharacterized protein n=1 Tax=Leishmania major TaxID=5664 RepID=Q4QB79_LEIMA|nr:hypothetical protein LMJF_23_0840 [Leishmania major strain Friedlin]CAG9574268.1 hypothetical_protein_-_conserved [Leishmania major strain Friedlin]CAJ04476.1 hypothetical protein LMJF_23_0840 [Leishmania major strain Friedlin]|eukprot:XP_001683419.1 hypothetical protein LMJF_23_0840 [Leishmania major strain Friedlin]
MKTGQRRGWGCVVRPPQLLLRRFFALILLFLCMHAACAKEAEIQANAWLSAPTSVWDAIVSDPMTHFAMIQAVKEDFVSAIRVVDSIAEVVVTSLKPMKSQKAWAGGPAYGAYAQFSAVTQLNKEEVFSALRSSNLRSINSIFQSVGFNAAIEVLAADGPPSMRAVGPVLLPVSGSTFFWQVLLGTLMAQNALSVDAFMYPLQMDIQSAVDFTVRKFLIETTPLTNQVNVSSWYVSYNVWAFPGAEVTPSTPSDLRAFAMKSRMPLFNTYMKTVMDTYPSLKAYADLLPTMVHARTPPLGNPFEDNSDSDPDRIFEVLANETGDYLLVFSGDADRWGQVWEKSRDAVSKSIEEAVEAKLHRRIFVNRAFVTSAKTLPNDSVNVGGLQVLCRVVQGITVISNHPWSPEEVAPLLLQANYSATQALYISGGGPVEGYTKWPPATASQSILLAASYEASPGSIATTSISYDYRVRLSKDIVGIIVMSVLIIGASLVAIIITVSFCYCCPQFIGGGADRKRTTLSHASIAP